MDSNSNMNLTFDTEGRGMSTISAMGGPESGGKKGVKGPTLVAGYKNKKNQGTWLASALNLAHCHPGGNWTSEYNVNLSTGY